MTHFAAVVYGGPLDGGEIVLPAPPRVGDDHIVDTATQWHYYEFELRYCIDGHLEAWVYHGASVALDVQSGPEGA